ncbi:hypothetical protein, partial [Nocardioides sp.]|uniref:hypothetical protein n=1 Tax=Nocardioides sp. TaxID=35761 RepID=UPI002EDB73C7
GATALTLLTDLAAGGGAATAGSEARIGRILGPHALVAVRAAAGDLTRARSALPRDARWVVEGIDDREELWRGEVAWWRRVERDGFALLAGTGFGRGPVVGATAVLAADARRVRAALETAADGTGVAREAFDDVA